MRCSSRLIWLFTGLLAVQAVASDGVGYIEFFGYKGLDISKVREALPVHEGDKFSNETKRQISLGVVKALGKDPTDVAVICCDEKGDRLIYVGLQGASSKGFSYNLPPNGRERLTPDITDLYGRVDNAVAAAVRKGGDARTEDDTNGYMLIKDPTARALQLELREWAIHTKRNCCGF